MKSLLALGLLAFATPLYAESPAGDKLLDKVISRPGSYSQVCDVMTAPADIPYRAFELTDFAGASFSKANQAAISKNRDALVKAIRARLLAIDFSMPAKQPAVDPKPEQGQDADNFGCDPKTLNPLLLELVRQLHATEALPELLAVEDKLVKSIAVAKDDAKAPPPVVSGWFVGMLDSSDETEDAARRDRKIDLFQARVAQRDLVMLMALLMREKSFEPYLKTQIEADYAKGLKALAKKNGLYKFKPGEPLPKELEYMEVSLDPVTKVPMSAHSPVSISYTRESRDEVRAAAAKWIEAHP
jgi:hypothetical protein